MPAAVKQRKKDKIKRDIERFKSRRKAQILDFIHQEEVEGNNHNHNNIHIVVQSKLKVEPTTTQIKRTQDETKEEDLFEEEKLVGLVYNGGQETITQATHCEVRILECNKCLYSTARYSIVTRYYEDETLRYTDPDSFYVHYYKLCHSCLSKGLLLCKEVICGNYLTEEQYREESKCTACLFSG
jgi:hypothetical protein